MEHWSVTLTGNVLPEVDSQAAWAKVQVELACDGPRFEQTIRQRLPVSFHADDEAAARHQQQLLEACGVEARLLADDGRRVWVRHGEHTCGPVSLGYAGHAVAAGSWAGTTLACLEGESQWRPLQDMLLGAAEMSGNAQSVPPLPPTAAGASAAHAAEGALPLHAQAVGLHAGFWIRFAAYLIDSLIVSTVVFVLAFIGMLAGAFAIGVSGSPDAFSIGVILLIELVALVGVWLYFALFESSRHQATPGKMALGLHVTGMDGQRIGFGRATGRFFGKYVSGLILDIGYMMAGWTERKQALHDMMASCCVIRRNGLKQWREQGAASPETAGGMPGWAVALIVVGGLFFTVIPVLAILAAIAVPSYQNYLVRAQVSEGMALSQTAKTAVNAYATTHGQFPADNDSAKLADPADINGTYVSAVNVYRGAVIITYGNRANHEIRGDHLVLTPQLSSDTVTWTCSSPDIKRKYLPVACRP